MLFKLFFGGWEYFKDKMMSKYYKSKMKRCGENVTLKPSTSMYLGLENISLGNNVSIPRFSHIFCSRASLTIGNNVIFGPAPTIVTGDHIINCIGTPMFLYKKKGPEEDLPIVIEDDVWVGANVTILKGVTIGRGSVVAAGCVVNKSTPPYSITGGIPGKTIRFRFTIDEIIEHERIIYPENERFSREELERIFLETKTKK